MSASALGLADNPNILGSDAGKSTASEFNRTEVERYVWEFTNDERAKHGLNRVEYAPRIVDPAREHSRNMAKHDYVGHTEPNGETGEERYAGVCDYSGSGYSFGENAYGAWYKQDMRIDNGEVVYLSTERELARYLVDGWMDSEGHRENILNPSWQELGVGIYKREDGHVFASQTFC